MNAAAAFFMRDLRVAWSYRFSFFFQNTSLLFSVLTLRFVSRLCSTVPQVESLQKYGGDYFSFVLIGAGISLLAYPVTKSFAGGVRAAQITGTFEAMLTTNVSGAAIVINSALYFPAVTVACLQLTLMWALGAALFGAHLDLVQLPLALVVVFMTVAILTGIGLLSAAFTIAFKQSEPVTTAFIAGSLLVSGIMYPVTVLPSWLQPLSPLLPLTHAADLTRYLFLTDDRSHLAGHFAALDVFCLLLPLGIGTLSYSLNYARRTGSLSQY